MDEAWDADKRGWKEPGRPYEDKDEKGQDAPHTNYSVEYKVEIAITLKDFHDGMTTVILMNTLNEMLGVNNASMRNANVKKVELRKITSESHVTIPVHQGNRRP